MNKTPHKIINPNNKNSVTFVETSRQSSGARTRVEVTLEAGGSNALHYHETFSERFTAVHGVLTLKTQEGELQLKPGETFVAAPLVLHSFNNRSAERITFEVEIAPANVDFECFLQVAYGLINDTWTLPGGFPINPLHLGALFALGDTHYTWLRAMTPFARLASWVSKKVGVHGRLISRYCETMKEE